MYVDIHTVIIVQVGSGFSQRGRGKRNAGLGEVYGHNRSFKVR